MKVSEYIFDYLYRKEVSEVFMLSGGGIMYLVDALGRSKIRYVCCHHEQAAGIAAQAYAMKKNGLGVCLVTTGPGGTNILTAVGASYVDSTPVIYITGQVKTSDFAAIRGVRQFGAQENDIVSMAKPVTKYATTILDANDIRYQLEKAIYYALNGRRGPVLLDIPLDIQNTDVDVTNLRGYDVDECGDEDILAYNKPDLSSICHKMESVIKCIKESKRPLMLVGHGSVAANALPIIEKIRCEYKIPVMTTWRVTDYIGYDDDMFLGYPGLQAPRYSNIIVQGCDLLIVLGSRLDNMITAFGEERFGVRAKKVVVDIDIKEIQKLTMPDMIGFNCDVKLFAELFYAKLKEIKICDYGKWISECKKIRNLFPLLNEKQDKVDNTKVDLYQFTMQLSDYCKDYYTLVNSSTSRCNTAGHIAFKHKKGQVAISSMGFGSMGFALPSVIGAWFASNKKPVVMIEGDGSLQLNIQEFQTIKHYSINAKMFIFHNEGYAAISTMQDRNFNGFHVGCDAESGVSMPNLEKISLAYGLTYLSIKNNADINDVLKKAFEIDGPVVCEFFGSIYFDEIPKCISSLNKEGVRVSAALENPYPFLSEEEMVRIYADMIERD